MIKPGVRLGPLTPQALLIITVAAPIWERLGSPNLTVTSGNDGRHSRTSTHYRGDGLDLRTRNLPGGYQGAAAREAAVELRVCLGDEYVVILESDHIHAHYRALAPGADPPAMVTA